jgi:hypothetical protein
VLEVTALANNDRTYLYVTDMQDNILCSNLVYLKKEKSTISMEFQAKTNVIRIGVMMGGDSIATPNDYFVVWEIALNYKNRNELVPNSGNLASISDIRITRIFDTIEELEHERQEPKRQDKSATDMMLLGEYAILKGLKQDDLYVYSKSGLQYVSRIGDASPSFWGTAMHSQPGKVMPIYDTQEEAKNDLMIKGDKFYEPRDKAYLWDSVRDELKTGIYLYLDKAGYVRWLSYPNNTSSDINTNIQ